MFYRSGEAHFGTFSPVSYIMKTKDLWAPALIAGVIALEALFSKDSVGAQTASISRRVGDFCGSNLAKK